MEYSILFHLAVDTRTHTGVTGKYTGDIRTHFEVYSEHKLDTVVQINYIYVGPNIKYN